MIAKYCPRCDRSFMGVSAKDALEAVAKHVGKAHPDMENYIQEELDDKGFDNGTTGSV